MAAADDESFEESDLDYAGSEARWQALPFATQKTIAQGVVDIIKSIIGEGKIPIVFYYSALPHLTRMKANIQTNVPVPLYDNFDQFSLSNWVEMAHFYNKTAEIEALFGPYGFETEVLGESRDRTQKTKITLFLCSDARFIPPNK